MYHLVRTHDVDCVCDLKKSWVKKLSMIWNHHWGQMSTFKGCYQQLPMEGAYDLLHHFKRRDVIETYLIEEMKGTHKF